MRVQSQYREQNRLDSRGRGILVQLLEPLAMLFEAVASVVDFLDQGILAVQSFKPYVSRHLKI